MGEERGATGSACKVCFQKIADSTEGDPIACGRITLSSRIGQRVAAVHGDELDWLLHERSR